MKIDVEKAEELFDQAHALDEEGHEGQAIDLYRQALEINPEHKFAHYNLGLIYKYRGQWEESFAHNKQAHALEPEDEAACWNLGIAATALRDWPSAREAWLDYGIKISDGEGEIEQNFGKTPVRLYSDEGAEVVWANRICPARAWIESIPFPESGFFFADVVLHDGAPEGSRMRGGEEYPVFNMLELFARLGFLTAGLKVEITSDDELEQLQDRLNQRKQGMEDWTSNVRFLCKQCSEGKPHEEHDEELASDEWQATRHLGIATKDAELTKQILQDWQESTKAQVIELEFYSEEQTSVLEPLPADSKLQIDEVDGKSRITIPYQFENQRGKFQAALLISVLLWLAGSIGLGYLAFFQDKDWIVTLGFFAWLCGGLYTVLSIYWISKNPKDQEIILKESSLYVDTGSPTMSFEVSLKIHDFEKKTLHTRKQLEFDIKELKTLKLRNTVSGTKLTLEKPRFRVNLAELATEQDRQWLYDLIQSKYLMD